MQKEPTDGSMSDQLYKYKVCLRPFYMKGLESSAGRRTDLGNYVSTKSPLTIVNQVVRRHQNT